LARDLADYDIVNIGAAGTFVVWKRISEEKLRQEMISRLPFTSDVIICNGADLIALAGDEPFAGEPSRPDIVRFVSVMASTNCTSVPMPVTLPGDSDWLLRVLGSKGRFLFGVYKRQMRAISHLTQIEKIFGVPLTTRNWNTITAIVKTLQCQRS